MHVPVGSLIRLERQYYNIYYEWNDCFPGTCTDTIHYRLHEQYRIPRVYIYIHIFMYMYNCLNIPRYPRVGEYISGQVLIYYLFLIWLGSGVYFTMTCMSQDVLLYMSLSSMSMSMFSESYIQYPYVAFPLSVFRHMSIFFLNGTSF